MGDERVAITLRDIHPVEQRVQKAFRIAYGWKRAEAVARRRSECRAPVVHRGGVVRDRNDDRFPDRFGLRREAVLPLLLEVDAQHGRLDASVTFP